MKFRETLDLASLIVSSRIRHAISACSGRPRPNYVLGDETPIQTFYDGKLFDPLMTRALLDPIKGTPTYGVPADLFEFTRVPNLTVKFEVDSRRSFFGDCIRVVNVRAEKSLQKGLPPFGWSGEMLLGGYALTSAAISGELEVTFSEDKNGFADFTIRIRDGLEGVGGNLSTPSGYALTVLNNRVEEILPVSHGRMQVKTGRFYDFHFNVRFSNSAIDLLCATNPGLKPPPLLFPGLPHAGHTMGWVSADAESRRLRITVLAQQFLPLGPSVDGSPLLMPGSHEAGPWGPFEAANSSLHPFIMISALSSEPVPVVAKAPKSQKTSFRKLNTIWKNSPVSTFDSYVNRRVILTCVPGFTDFGDNFALQSESLGGEGLARSPLFGKLALQFGQPNNGTIPFTLELLTASDSLEAKTQKLLSLLPPGTKAGLVGLHGKLEFPNRTYMQHQLSLTTDPYKVSVGVLDASTGLFENMVLRKYLFQNVMRKLLTVEPRTPTDSFCYVCEGQFGSATNFLTFQLYGDFVIPYPEGYAFPLPDGGRTRIGPNSYLQPFLNIAAIEECAFKHCLGEINFRGVRQVRGRFESGCTLSVTRDGAMVFLDGPRTHSGKFSNMRMAEVNGTQLIELEFYLGNSTRSVNCYAFFFVKASSCELLVVSENEEFDTWMEGAARFQLSTAPPS